MQFTADERTQIEAILEETRDEVSALLDGLTDEQARRRLVPSRTSVASLVKHCTFVEQVWFHVAFEGRTRAEMGLPTAVDDSFLLTDADTVEALRDGYRVARADSLRIAATYGLDDCALHSSRSPVSLRWVYLHLIRELARHCGHGDILREQILAADADADAGATS